MSIEKAERKAVRFPAFSVTQMPESIACRKARRTLVAQLGPRIFRHARGHLWGVPEARALLSTKCTFALRLWELGRRRRALEQAQELVELDMFDHQGMRYSLFCWLIESGKIRAARRLYDAFDYDGSSAWRYHGALLLFHEEGPSYTARKYLIRAHKSNKHVIEYFLGRARMPSEIPDSVDSGSTEEAALYMQYAMMAWVGTDGVGEWLSRVFDAPVSGGYLH